MIGCFPDPYPDELVFSWLARYATKAGYIGQVYVLRDLYAFSSPHISVQFINAYTDDVVRHMTAHLSWDEIILQHTMFPCYGRFLHADSREKAFRSVSRGDPYLNQQLHTVGWVSEQNHRLRYCPLCAAADKVEYGETYWHRTCQLPGLRICPAHGCFLREVDLFSEQQKYVTLKTAEDVIAEEHTEEHVGNNTENHTESHVGSHEKNQPTESTEMYGATRANAEQDPELSSVATQICENTFERELAVYEQKVFTAPLCLDHPIDIREFWTSQFIRAGYSLPTGRCHRLQQLMKDLSEACCILPDFHLKEAVPFKKLYTGQANDFHSACILGFFLHIPPEVLGTMPTGSLSSSEKLHAEVRQLASQQVPYRQIASLLHTSVSTVLSILHPRARSSTRIPGAAYGGMPPLDWVKEDADRLAAVKSAIEALQDPANSPQRITQHRIEQFLHLRIGFLNKCPRCLEEIRNHTLTQEEFWAFKTVWAAQKVIAEHRLLNFNQLHLLTHMNRIQFHTCLPHIHMYADDALTALIVSL